MKLLTVIASLLMCSSVMASDIYMIKTKIGDNVFDDIFVYGGCQGAKFEGSVTVPGVFTAKAEDTKCSFTWTGESASFKITVRENNQEYDVYYAMRMNNKSIGGVLRQNGEIIGSIEGELIYSGE